MSDWPDSATRHSKPVVLAEARRRGLIAPDGGAEWLYMFHDIHDVAHFRHVSRRAYMQMLPDGSGPDGEDAPGITSTDGDGADSANDNSAEPAS